MVKVRFNVNFLFRKSIKVVRVGRSQQARIDEQSRRLTVAPHD